ncbi:hypothetical protein [Neisseria dumasiana]|nr:hypothetical protein [Neisseria dumasiana]UOO84957.1 hypothetical protein LVJ88_02830 [Neisseria dumasiana]
MMKNLFLFRQMIRRVVVLIDLTMMQGNAISKQQAETFARSLQKCQAV